MRITFCLLLAFLSLNATGQEQMSGQSRSHTFTIAWGFRQMARQDQVFSPFVHRGSSPVAAHLAYERRKGATSSRLDLGVGLLGAHHSEGFYYYDHQGDKGYSGDHRFVLVDLDYGLSWTLSHSSNWRFSAGAALYNTVNSINYSFGRSGSFGYLASFGMGARLGMDGRLFRKGRLALELDLPLAAWVARSPYLVNDDEFIENNYSHNGFKTFLALVGDGRAATLNHLQQLDLSAGYTWPLTPGLDLLAAYRFRFLRYTEPLEIRAFQQQLEFGMKLKF